jgi:hypothetical protein
VKNWYFNNIESSYSKTWNCLLLFYLWLHLFIYFGGTRVWTRIKASSLPLEPCPQPFLLLITFLDRVSCLCQAILKHEISYLCLLCSWDNRHIPSCLTYALGWSLTNFFALGGFNLQYTWSPPFKQLRLQVWASGSSHYF